MPTVRLVHWKEMELDERVARLASAGFDVEPWSRVDGPGLLRSLAEHTPDAVVIDLARLPSHGREVGVALRSKEATRWIPLVFVGGAPEKVARVREVLPDAGFTTWRGVRAAVTRAIARPPGDPVRPASRMSAYAKTPLPKKLGIAEGSAVALVHAPREFEATLAPLPPGVRVRRGTRVAADVTLFFAKDRDALEREIEAMLPRAARGGLWILWAKKGSAAHTDLTQQVVRRLGMDAGLVDYKICSVDATWSALRFTNAR